MNFTTIRDAVRTLLKNNAAGQFAVIDGQKRGKSGNDALDTSRMVEVYFSESSFPESMGPRRGRVTHDVKYFLDLTVAKGAEADMATIENPGSTPAEIAAAIASMKNSGTLADDSLDELFELVFGIIMATQNYDLGLAKGTVMNRWVSTLTKDEPLDRGDYTLLTGRAVLTCRTMEDVVGEVATPLEDPEYDVEIEIETDTPGKAGVLVTN